MLRSELCFHKTRSYSSGAGILPVSYTKIGKKLGSGYLIMWLVVLCLENVINGLKRAVKFFLDAVFL